MRISVYILLLLVALTSCKKFKYEQTEIQSCDLCDFADNLNGVYKGFLWQSTFANPFVPVNPNWDIDTFEYHMQHIFLNKGPDIDSNVMYFSVAKKYYYDATFVYDTISIGSDDGEVFTTYYDAFQINFDSVYFEKLKLTEFAQYVTTTKYIGYRP